MTTASVPLDSFVVAEGVLVVRSATAWAVAPATRREVIDLDGPAVVALLAGASSDLSDDLRSELVGAGVLVPGPSDPGGEVAGDWALPDASPPTSGSIISPRAAVVGRVAGGRLVIEATDGGALPLDGVDVYLLDVISQPITVREVLDAVEERLGQASPPGPELEARLARLVSSGRVQVDHADEEPDVLADADAEASVPAPPPDPTSSAVRRLRGVLGRVVRRRSRAGSAESPDPVVEPVTTVDGIDPLAEPTNEAENPPVGAGPPDLAVTYLEPPFPGGAAGPVPVYAVWPTLTGPVLALGMLTAAARHHEGGRLGTWYEIRRPEHPVSFFADLEARTGPAVLLLSNYVWSIEENLDIARRARALCPDLVIIHGGPSTPKYEADVETYFRLHDGLVDVTVRGEGEATLVAILAALGPSFPAADLAALASVEGLSYRDPSTQTVVRTPDRDRIATLDDLPSAYLTGEFDHVPVSAWDVPSGLLGLIFESNRGCPYGCTFCDWGSSTLSRIRKFSMERVEAEMRWAAERGHDAWIISDANFGIISRDVEIADRMAELKAEYGHPSHFGFNVAKNTTKHLTAILDRLVGACVTPHFSLALQTRDEGTLEAVDRTNISTDHYLGLAAAFRRRALPLEADIMVGLPGQTVESFAADLQFLMDHEIPARMWITELLPNAPMNDPAYRERYAIEVNDHLVVTATSSFTTADRATMMRLRHAYTAFERFGILRQVVRWAQWDHDVPAMAVIRRIVELSDEDPGRYPLLNWVARYFDYFNVPPIGWGAFFTEVGVFLDVEFGIGPSPDRDLVLGAQAFLLPEVDRAFPDTLPLAHDLVAYVRDHTRGLWADGTPSTGRRLSDYGPGELTVFGDPLDRCGIGLTVNQDPRNEVLTENFWIVGHWELDSLLVANYSEVAGDGSYRGVREQIPADLGTARPHPVPASAVQVDLTPSPRSAARS